MGSLFGQVVQPTASQPTIGTGSQTNFFNALYGLGLTQNPQGGGMMFNSMPSYQGQLTPDLNNMMSSNVWNSWSPNVGGSSQAQSMLGGIQSQIGQNAPSLSQYLSNPQQVSYGLPASNNSVPPYAKQMMQGSKK